MPYLTPQEAAEELRVTRRTLYTWLRSGRLKGYRAGDKWLIDPDAIKDFLKLGENKDIAISEEANTCEIH
jgi:excisionase family DNA binding protein